MKLNLMYINVSYTHVFFLLSTVRTHLVCINFLGVYVFFDVKIPMYLYTCMYTHTHTRVCVWSLNTQNYT